MQYKKGAITFAEQLAQLEKRGLVVDDAPLAMHYLERVGYYRLMGYLYPFRKPDSDDFAVGASFKAAVDFYEFDQKLRGLVLDAICHIEVAVRTAVTYDMGHAHGAFAHCDPLNFAFGPQWHASWLAGVEAEVDRARETFIEHYKNKYDGFPTVPIWMATEVMSLGSVSKMVKGMHATNQKTIAARFCLAAPVFSSFLHAVSVVRNICAHHSRLWNRVLGVRPALPRSGAWQNLPQAAPDRIFLMLLVIRTLLAHTSADRDEWRDQVSGLLRTILADPANQTRVGAPANWENHPLWR
jgi:abortive infection bacteriophage resistance protein